MNLLVSLVIAGWVLLALLSTAGCSLPPGEPATPQRPTFYFGPTTTAEGTWELEAGVVVEADDYGELPTTWKYGYGDHTEVSLAVSPLVRVDDQVGFGDTGLGWRHRFIDANGVLPAVAVLATAKFPTADEDRGLGSGETDVYSGLTAGGSFGRFGWNTYLQVGSVGVDGDGDDFVRDLSLAGSWTIDERNSAFLEWIDHDVQEQDVNSEQVRTGTYYTVRPDLVLDWAVYLPVNDEAPDTQFAIGLTRNFGRP